MDEASLFRDYGNPAWRQIGVLISKRVRGSLLTFTIAGVFGLVGVVLRGPVPLPSVDVNIWANVVSSESYFLAQLLTLIAYVLPYFGFWGIYASLAEKVEVERAAFWGFILSIIGTSLAIAMLGVFSYVSPYLAELYLLGEENLPDIVTQIATGRPLWVNLTGGFLYLFGTFLLGWSIWRSGRFKRWPGFLIALHGLCLVFGFMFFPVLILSWVFLILAGLGLFLNLDK